MATPGQRLFGGIARTLGFSVVALLDAGLPAALSASACYGSVASPNRRGLSGSVVAQPHARVVIRYCNPDLAICLCA